MHRYPLYLDNDIIKSVIVKAGGKEVRLSGSISSLSAATSITVVKVEIYTKAPIGQPWGTFHANKCKVRGFDYNNKLPSLSTNL